LKEFAGIIAIIQNLVFSHTCCDGGIELKSALNVVIIIVWDFQKDPPAERIPATVSKMSPHSKAMC
jgi:hypothetical protein